jgi:hypothetical protein
MKIKYKTFRIFSEEMKTIDPDTRLNIKKIFPEWNIIFKLKILFELFRSEDEFFLEKINKYR